MRTDKWIKSIKMRLGYPVVKIFTTDDMINNLIEQAVDKITSYITVREVITGMSPNIDLRDYGVITIYNVWPTRNNTGTSQNTFDVFSPNVFMINSFSGMQNLMSRVMIYNQYVSELPYLNPRTWYFNDGILYLSGYTGTVSIECLTEQCLEKITPTQQDWILNYSLALLKEVEGEIRSKVKIEGTPYELNGNELKNEGKSEKDELLQQLGTSRFGSIVVTRGVAL